MSRLLFAAARGARIERHPGAVANFWVPANFVWLGDDGWTYRIHPDDEHLQYGPISSALREFAETGKEPYTLSGLMAMRALSYEALYPFVLKTEWHHAEMFALILAEALADEGL